MRDHVVFRFWMLMDALLAIIYKTTRAPEWRDVSFAVLFEELANSFRRGHIPLKFFSEALRTDFDFGSKRAYLHSTRWVTEKFSSILRNQLHRPYNETRVLKKYMNVICYHYDFCDYCQDRSVLYYADFLQLNLTLLKKERAESADEK